MSKELNHFGSIEAFLRDWAPGHWQEGLRKAYAPPALSVSLLPNLRKHCNRPKDTIFTNYNCPYGTPTVPRDIHLGVVDHYSEEAKRVKTLCGRKTCLGVIDSPWRIQFKGRTDKVHSIFNLAFSSFHWSNLEAMEYSWESFRFEMILLFQKWDNKRSSLKLFVNLGIQI